MANTLLTPSVIAQEALFQLENNLVATNLVHRGHTSEFTAAKVGDTVTIRKPATFAAQEFSTAISVQTAVEAGIPIVLEKHFDVSFEVTSREWTLSVSDFSSQLIEPAVIALAQAVDNYILSKGVQVGNFSGSVATPANPATLDAIAAIDEKMNTLKIPVSPRIAIVNPSAKRSLFSVSQFTDAEKRSDGGRALREASMGRFMGIDWFMSQNVNRQTASTGFTGTIVTTGANAVGAKTISVTTGAGEAVDLVAGAIVSFAGDTKTYAVASAVTIGASTTGNLVLTEGIEVAHSGGEAVTHEDTDAQGHAMNLAMHPNAISCAIVPLDLPRGASNASYLADRGLGIRTVVDYNSTAKKDVVSLDLLVGAVVQDPRLAVRVPGV